MTSVASRPQVGIERLPAARRPSTEQRELMNCKSCRKRKIKCDRLRPTCEACNVFQCACVYDAIPKKRGPKTDVLEALLKRVDGLEKKLREENKSSASANSANKSEPSSANALRQKSPSTSSQSSLPAIDTSFANQANMYSPVTDKDTSPTNQQDVLIDAYFQRIHDKPFHILDEATTRQQQALGQIPIYLRLAIYATAARFIDLPNGYNAAVRMSEEYAMQARSELDVDEPTIEGLQTAILLHNAFFALGKGRKAYMLLASAIGMATALNLHREPPPKSKTTPAEKELRRHLFWTCYILDRFTACGSKRSSLLEDRAIRLRLPSWRPHANALPLEGEYFNTQSNLHCHLGPARSQGSMGMLIDATRILGNTNNYLAAGGVKGDSHFPWHALSNLSKIRADLDVWAQGNDDVLANPTGILTQSDGVTLMLSKLTYHLIHCLIYRPFLPIDLAELRGTGQHQSWQIEATNLCFMHANAITELAQFARQTPAIEWPSFIGYCLATAGTVHVHGAHYKGNEGEIYSSSAGYLSLEMQQLLELRYTWACIQHQKETLQTIYLCHTELVKTLANSPMRFSPVFHLEDFFDRYPGHLFDGAHVPLMDVVMEARNESLMGHIRERNEQIVTLPSSGPSSSRGSTFQKPNTPLSASFLHKSQVPMHQTNGRTKSRRLTGSASISSLAQHDLNGELPSQEHPQTITEMHLNQIPSILNFPSPLPHTLPSQIINPFSPSFTYSPLPQGSFDSVFGTPAPLGRNGPPDSGAGVPTTHQHVTTIGNNHVYSHYDPSQHVPSVITPGGRSVAGSTQQDGDTDPFLTLLEQLAENEHSRGGPSELDFYLGPQDG